jgi:lantibiotic modifying enzyme
VATMPDDGLFSGWAGVTVALRAWSRATGGAAAAEAAAQVTSQIAGRILAAPDDPARCTDIISGDAGILLALIADDSDTAVRAAHLLAGRLVEVAERGPDGLHWRMVPGWEYLMPGFSHGTAGVAYALAGAGRALHRRDLVRAARAAPTLLSPPGSTPAAGRCPSRSRHKRAAWRSTTAGATVLRAPCDCSSC